MAAMYLDADVPALTRLAVLVDRAASGELGERVLGEMRLLEDRFGLNPVSRRRLQWEVEHVGRRDGVEGAVSEDEARWLRAVDSD
jgi:Ser/Thr protein kinase RdoA (MazF antagonist)